MQWYGVVWYGMVAILDDHVMCCGPVCDVCGFIRHTASMQQQIVMLMHMFCSVSDIKCTVVHRTNHVNVVRSDCRDSKRSISSTTGHSTWQIMRFAYAQNEHYLVDTCS